MDHDLRSLPLDLSNETSLIDQPTKSDLGEVQNCSKSKVTIYKEKTSEETQNRATSLSSVSLMTTLNKGIRKFYFKPGTLSYVLIIITTFTNIERITTLDVVSTFDPDKHFFAEAGVVLRPLNKAILLSKKSIVRHFRIDLPNVSLLKDVFIEDSEPSCIYPLQIMYINIRSMEYWFNNYGSISGTAIGKIHGYEARSQLRKVYESTQHFFEPKGDTYIDSLENFVEGKVTIDWWLIERFLSKHINLNGSLEIENFNSSTNHTFRKQAMKAYFDLPHKRVQFDSWLENVDYGLKNKSSHTIGASYIIRGMCLQAINLHKAIIHDASTVLQRYSDLRKKITLLLPEVKSDESSSSFSPNKSDSIKDDSLTRKPDPETLAKNVTQNPLDSLYNQYNYGEYNYYRSFHDHRSKRRKRSIQSWIGRGLSAILGVESEYEADKTRFELNSLKAMVSHTISGNLAVSSRMNASDQRLLELSETVSKSLILIKNTNLKLEAEISEKFHMLSDIQENEREFFKSIIHKSIVLLGELIISLASFSSDIRKILFLISDLELSIIDINNHKIPLSLLSPDIISNDIDNLNEHLFSRISLTNKLQIPSEVIFNLDLLLDVSGFVHGDDLNLVVHYPLLDVGSEKENTFYQLFELSVMPLKLTDQKFSVLDINQVRYLAISNHNFREFQSHGDNYQNAGQIIAIKNDDLYGCKGKDDSLIMCQSESFLPVNTPIQSNNCLYGLLTKTELELDDHLLDNCKTTVLKSSDLPLSSKIKVIQNFVIFLESENLQLKLHPSVSDLLGESSHSFKVVSMNDYLMGSCLGICFLEVPCNSEVILDERNVITQRFCTDDNVTTIDRKINIKPLNMLKSLFDKNYFKSPDLSLESFEFLHNHSIDKLLSILESGRQKIRQINSKDWTEILRDDDNLNLFQTDFSPTLSLNYLNLGGMGGGLIEFIILIILSCVACRHNRKLRDLQLAYMVHKVDAQELQSNKSVFEKLFGDLPKPDPLYISPIQRNFSNDVKIMSVSEKSLVYTELSIKFIGISILLVSIGSLIVSIFNLVHNKYWPRNSLILCIQGKNKFVWFELTKVNREIRNLMLTYSNDSYSSFDIVNGCCHSVIKFDRFEFLINTAENLQFLIPTDFKIPLGTGKTIKDMGDKFDLYLIALEANESVTFLGPKQPKHAVVNEDMRKKFRLNIRDSLIFDVNRAELGTVNAITDSNIKDNLDVNNTQEQKFAVLAKIYPGLGRNKNQNYILTPSAPLSTEY